MKKAVLFMVAGFFVMDVAWGGAGCNKKADSGKVSGVVTFHGINCQPGQPDFNIPPCTGPYPNFKVEVFESDGKSLKTTVMTDAKGNYNADLPSGSYVIFTQDGPMENNRKENAFSVRKGSVMRLDLNVSTGIQ
jgi:hypothetical protein